MNMSLYEAHNVVKLLEKEISAGYDTEKQINIFSETDYGLWLANAQAVTANDIMKQHQLIDVRSAIRRLIQTANETSGINDLVAEERRLMDQYQLSFNIAKEGVNQPHFDANAVQRTVEQMSQASNSFMRNVAHIYTVPHEVIDSEATNAKGLAKQLGTVKAKLVGLNHNTYIQIDKEMAEFLQELDLI